MSDESISTRIKRILESVLEVSPEDIGDTFGPADTELWDSLNALRIVSELESEFGIRLAMEDIPKMATFTAIRETVDRYLQEAGLG